MNYFIGIDLGTSATKSILMDEQGKVICSDSYEYKLYQPGNGWAEQKPEDWKRAALTTVKNIVKASGVLGKDIRGIGLSGQMHGLVMLDEKNEVIRDSIIWCDQRSGKQVEDMLRLMPKEDWLRITANPPLAAWTAAKILWVKENEPQIWERCRHILLPKDYVRYVLTGEYATDVSDASGMQLLDVKNRCWSEEVMEKLQIDKCLLGRVYESQEIVGAVLPEIARECGLSEDTLVVAGASDNAAAGIGTGTVHDGNALTSLGTSAVLYTHLDHYVEIPEGSLHVCCCAVPGCFHTMGGPQSAGLSIEWFKNNFCREYEKKAEEEKKSIFEILDAEIRKLPIGSDKLLYLPYLMGERTPHMNPDCRAVFFGLNAIHTKAHFFRAILEGITYSLNDCVNLVKAQGIEVTSTRVCGGGSHNPLWRQIMADLYRCNIRTLKEERGPAYGAALLAGAGTGVFTDIREACDRFIEDDEETVYREENARKYDKYQELYDRLYEHLKDDFSILAHME